VLDAGATRTGPAIRPSLGTLSASADQPSPLATVSLYLLLVLIIAPMLSRSYLISKPLPPYPLVSNQRTSQFVLNDRSTLPHPHSRRRANFDIRQVHLSVLTLRESIFRAWLGVQASTRATISSISFPIRWGITVSAMCYTTTTTTSYLCYNVWT
jgi:hypothetical protein